MKLNIIRHSHIFFTVVAAGLFFGCSPEEVKGGNPLSNPTVDASFTTSADNSGNHITASGQQGGDVLVHRWNTGSGEFVGTAEEEFFFPDAGTYTITHTVYSNGGSFNTSTQDVIVATPDPVAGNLILGGKFLTADDYAQWTVLNIQETDLSWEFTPGGATVTGTASGGPQSQQAIYQAVQVEAGQVYKVDMHVEGTLSTTAWLEVYVSASVPVQNSDYAAQWWEQRFGLNTWTGGCADGPINGQFSSISCAGFDYDHISFDTSGTVYLVIKGGINGGNIDARISNIELRRVN